MNNGRALMAGSRLFTVGSLTVLVVGLCAPHEGRCQRVVRRQPIRRVASAHPSGAAPTRPAPEKKKEEPKSPRQMAAQISRIVSRKKAAHPIYLNYQKVFYQFAAQEKARPVSSQQAAVYRAQLVQHLQRMGDLLGSMGEQVRIREAIQRGTSSIPPEDRQTTFAEGGRQHDLLLKQFVSMAKVLPERQTKTTAAAAPRQQ